MSNNPADYDPDNSATSNFSSQSQSYIIDYEEDPLHRLFVVFRPFYSLRKRLMKNKYYDITVTILYFLIYLSCGILFFHFKEDWGIENCIAFSITTMTTVGYGYHHPTDDTSRIFTLFYMLFGIYLIFANLSKIIGNKLQQMNSSLYENEDYVSVGKLYRKHRYRVFFWVFLLIAFNFIGALVLMNLEDWSFVSSIYFAVETATSVGYGDLKIKNDRSTHLFLAFFIVISIVLFSFTVNDFYNIHEEYKHLDKLSRVIKKKVDLNFVSDLDNGSGVTEAQFVLAMLQHMEILDYDKHIIPLMNKFRELNVDKYGKVYKSDLIGFSMRESMMMQSELSKITTMLGNSSTSQLPISDLISAVNDTRSSVVNMQDFYRGSLSMNPFHRDSLTPLSHAYRPSTVVQSGYGESIPHISAVRSSIRRSEAPNFYIPPPSPMASNTTPFSMSDSFNYNGSTVSPTSLGATMSFSSQQHSPNQHF